jgi:hypothetical protein
LPSCIFQIAILNFAPLPTIFPSHHVLFLTSPQGFLSQQAQCQWSLVYLQVQLLVDHVIPWPIGWAQSVLSVLYCSSNLRIHLASNPFITICWFGHVSKVQTHEAAMTCISNCPFMQYRKYCFSIYLKLETGPWVYLFLIFNLTTWFVLNTKKYNYRYVINIHTIRDETIIIQCTTWIIMTTCLTHTAE